RLLDSTHVLYRTLCERPHRHAVSRPLRELVRHKYEVKPRPRLKEDAKRHARVVFHRATHAFLRRGIGLVFTRHWPKTQRVSCELAHQFVSYARKARKH